MDPVVGALQDQRDELAALVADLDEANLLRPSRCEGWTVADVLLHLAQTDEMGAASVAGDLDAFLTKASEGMDPGGDIDSWAGALVDEERGAATGSRDRYLASSQAQVDAFAACDPGARLAWVAGDLAARSLATTRLTQCWIHTVDVGFGLDAVPAPTERLWHTARLAWRTVPYAFVRAGLEASGDVAFVLDAPPGATSGETSSGGETWTFGDPASAPTVVTGTALDLCTVAGQRASAAGTSLVATGPDGDAVLRLVRTFA